MRRLTLVAGLLLTVARPVTSQTPAAPEAFVEGRVLAATTGAPLSGARVSANDRAVESDATGRFRLALPAGRWILAARAAGHLPDTREVELRGGETRTVDLYLLEPARLKETVEVVAEASDDSEEPSTLPVRPADVMQLAGAGENVFRTLQILPGVAAAEEFGSRLAVRGGGPDQNLTVLDGVEVHNPYRLFGLTSAFNPETVERFELNTGAFSVRYGDRLSSLLVVESRAGAARSGLNGSSALSLTDANVVFEGALPRGASGSWLLTARRTYYDIVAERFVNSDLPAFTDVQGQLSWELAPGRRLTLFGLASREGADAFFEGDRPGEQGDFVSEAQNDLMSLRFDALLGTRGFSRTLVSFYRNADVLDVDAQFRSDVRRSNAPDDDTAFSSANVVFTRDLVVRDVALRQDLGWQVSPRHHVETGFELHGLRTSVGWSIPGDRNPNAANGSSIRGGAGLPPDLHSARDGLRAGLYVLDRFDASGSLTLEPGLRFDHAGANGRATLSPRLGATLRLDERTRLRAGAGLFTQSPGYEKLIQADYFVDLSDTGALDLVHERSWHAVLGLERDFGSGLTLRAEGYYKTFDWLVVGRLETETERLARIASYDFPEELRWSIPTDPQITSQPENAASGRAYGFDLYVARRAASADTRLSGWAAYTYGVAERDNYGIQQPFDYDRRHALNVAGGWRFGPRWDLSATLRLASGFPRTPVLGLRVSAVEDATGALVPERDALGGLVYTTDLGSVSNLNTDRLPLVGGPRLHDRPGERLQPEHGPPAAVRPAGPAPVVSSWGLERALALLYRRDQRPEPPERRRLRGAAGARPDGRPAEVRGIAQPGVAVPAVVRRAVQVLTQGGSEAGRSVPPPQGGGNPARLTTSLRAPARS
jgi:hypothetical protein